MTGYPVQISRKELEGLAAINANMKEFCAFFNCHHQTIENRIKEFYGSDVDFRKFKDMHKAKTMVSLKRLALREAARGKGDMIRFLWEKYADPEDEGFVNVRVSGPRGEPIKTEATIIPGAMTIDQLRAEAIKRGLPTSVFESALKTDAKIQT